MSISIVTFAIVPDREDHAAAILGRTSQQTHEPSANSRACSMWTDAILAYLHFAAIFTLIWLLAKEWTLLRGGAAQVDIERLARADAGCDRAAGDVLEPGALRATLGIKGWGFRPHNPVF